MKNTKKYIITILTLLVLMVGGPIIINELYKQNSGYITLWGAKEVFNYYGMMLGALVSVSGAVYVMKTTIKFTRKQIIFEKEIEDERKKWEKVEELLDKKLSLISPMQYITMKIDVSKTENFLKACSQLIATQAELKTSLDWFKCYITPDEYNAIKPCIDMILPVIEKESNLCERLRIQYYQLGMNQLEGQIKTREQIRDNISDDRDILNKILEIKQEFSNIQINEYQNILNCRRDVFVHIYGTLREQKNSVLAD